MHMFLESAWSCHPMRMMRKAFFCTRSVITIQSCLWSIRPCTSANARFRKSHTRLTTAAISRGEGKDVTIVTYSAMVDVSLKAAEQLAEEGIEAEVVDIRTLEPLDTETIVNSVKKTRHAVVVHEACQKGGFGAEIIAQVQEHALEALESPILRVAAPNVPVPFAVDLEKSYVPKPEQVIEAVKKSLKK